MMAKNKQEDGHLINMRDSWQVLFNTIQLLLFMEKTGKKFKRQLKLDQVHKYARMLKNSLANY